MTPDTRVILLCAQCSGRFECRVLSPGDRLVLPASLGWAERERWTTNGVATQRVPLCRVCYEQHRRADSWQTGELDLGGVASG